ncbi:MAG: DUF2461 domain-containing protein [Chitinophagaceae bacterium]|nr:DUF2461 domain-containing protein [Chitinophagaceae bacterium]
MIQESTLNFLSKLSKNNNKPWFDENRPLYEAAKSNIITFTGELIKQYASIDASIGHLKPSDCLFRINRDVRFSKNKEPYKTNFGISISKGGKKGALAGYYVHIEPGKAFIGGGMYMPMGDGLQKIRQEIDYNFKDFQAILKNKAFKTSYGDLDYSDQLSRIPKGYEKDNEAEAYLRLKSFVALRPLKNEELTSKQFVKTCMKHFEALMPLVEFLNTAVG